MTEASAQGFFSQNSASYENQMRNLENQMQQSQYAAQQMENQCRMQEEANYRAMQQQHLMQQPINAYVGQQRLRSLGY